jgi:hypothetical protein
VFHVKDGTFWQTELPAVGASQEGDQEDRDQEDRRKVLG